MPGSRVPVATARRCREHGNRVCSPSSLGPVVVKVNYLQSENTKCFLCRSHDRVAVPHGKIICTKFSAKICSKRRRNCRLSHHLLSALKRNRERKLSDDKLYYLIIFSISNLIKIKCSSRAMSRRRVAAGTRRYTCSGTPRELILHAGSPL